MFALPQHRIIAREEDRVSSRLRAHLANDVWERRESPPKDWNAPLSDHLADKAEDSYLAQFQRQATSGEREGSWVEENSRKLSHAMMKAVPSMGNGACVVM